MKARGCTAWALIGGLLALPSLQAQTQAEEEAHIAALISAELAAEPAPRQLAKTVDSAPAPVIAEVFARSPEAEQDWLASPEARDPGLPFAELGRLQGRRVTIVTTGERVHRGIVSAATDRSVTLQVRRAGGRASYTLQRQQVLRIDPR